MAKNNRQKISCYPFFTAFLVLLIFVCANSRAEDIAIIVHPNNPVKNLSVKEIKKIFLGRLRMFPDTNQATQVLDQEASSETYQYFYEEHIGFSISKLKRYRAAYLFSGKGVLPSKLGDHQSIKEKVISDKNAIGYINSKFVDEKVKVVYRWTSSD